MIVAFFFYLIKPAVTDASISEFVTGYMLLLLFTFTTNCIYSWAELA